MADITASLSTVRQSKTIMLDGFGEFELRQMGSNEELNLSIKRRRLNKIVDETEKIISSLKEIENSKDPNEKKVKTLLAEAEALGDEAIEIREQIDKSFKACFTQIKGQPDIYGFIDTLTETERMKLLGLYNQPLIAEQPGAAK